MSGGRPGGDLRDGADGDGSKGRKRGRPARGRCSGLAQGNSACAGCSRPELKKRCTYRMAVNDAVVVAQGTTPTARQ
eukprot:47617-Eustigmatos_ZCMA.PRE.1